MRAHVRRRIAAVGCLAVALGLLTAAPSAAAPAWLDAQTVSGTATANTLAAQLVVDRFGNTTAVWSRSSSGQGYVQAAHRPAGGSWSGPVTISDPLTFASDPDLVVDASGTVTAAWLTSVSGAHRIDVARLLVDGTWTLSDFGADASADGPRLAVDDAGRVTVAYVQDRGSVNNVVRTATSDAAGVWSAPVDASDPTGNSVRAAVAVSPASGFTVVAWQTLDGTMTRVEARRRAAGGAWSDREVVSDPGISGFNARAGVDDAGNATIVYEKQDSTTLNFVAMASSASPSGGWSTPTPISASGQSVQDLVVQSSPSGEVMALWRSYNGSHHVVQAVIRPSSGGWTAPVDVSDAAMEAASLFTSMAPDGTGYAAWHVYVGGGSGNLVQTAARPPGGTWTAPATVATDSIALGDQSGELSFDAAGDGAIAFSNPYPTAANIRVLGFDGAGPVVQLAVPASALAGTSVSMSATATDTWSAVASYVWSFGDGGTATGPATSHTYAAPGSYTVSITVTDALGNTTTRTATTTVTAMTPAPVIGTFKLTRSKILAAARALATKTKLKVGLNTAATLKLVVRSKHHHRVNGKNKFVKVVIRKALPAGTSRITIKAKLKGVRLKPDTYVLTGTATNTVGKSPKKKAKLRVVR